MMMMMVMDTTSTPTPTMLPLPCDPYLTTMNRYRPQYDDTLAHLCNQITCTPPRPRHPVMTQVDFPTVNSDLPVASIMIVRTVFTDIAEFDIIVRTVVTMRLVA